MGLSLDLSCVFSAVLTRQNDLNSVGRTPLDFTYEKYLTDPTVDSLWWDTRELAASTAEELDVTSGLTDVYGVPINLASIYALAVVADLDNVGNLALGGSPDNFGALDPDGAVFIPPGGSVFLSAPFAGWAVNAGATNIVKLENLDASTAARYNIMIAGKAA